MAKLCGNHRCGDGARRLMLPIVVGVVCIIIALSLESCTALSLESHAEDGLLRKRLSTGRLKTEATSGSADGKKVPVPPPDPLAKKQPEDATVPITAPNVHVPVTATVQHPVPGTQVGAQTIISAPTITRSITAVTNSDYASTAVSDRIDTAVLGALNLDHGSIPSAVKEGTDVDVCRICVGLSFYLKNLLNDEEPRGDAFFSSCTENFNDDKATKVCEAFKKSTNIIARLKGLTRVTGQQGGVSLFCYNMILDGQRMCPFYNDAVQVQKALGIDRCDPQTKTKPGAVHPINLGLWQWNETGNYLCQVKEGQIVPFPQPKLSFK
eukprot:GFYU01003689.1.p1 GENE.GFYU01003689.1~~GFYU01003689.1.p1  ORF type:complete len:324 (-),score=72.30 GFYU01003689.1:277-1248(-)